MKQHIKQTIQQVGSKFLHLSDNQIFQVKNLLSGEDCDSVIDFYEKSPGKEVKSEKGIDFYTGIGVNITGLPCFSKICSGFDAWVKRYPFLETMPYRWMSDPHSNIQKYVPNQAYSGLHMEHGSANQLTLRRIAAWMIYLNDVEDGGETEFPMQNLRLKPRAGDFYIWPAGWTHPHKGIPSSSQEKYILTGWIIFV